MLSFKRSKCVVLPLVLKGRGSDAIETGAKAEEYRTAARMTWLVSGVFSRDAGCYADPEMGEPTDKPHYAITLCERIELEDDQ